LFPFLWVMLEAMEYQNLYQDGMPVPPPPPPPARKPVRRSRRIAVYTAAAAALFGGGTAAGIAMTGGASAATGSSAAHHGDAAKCRELAATLRRDGHPQAGRRLGDFCRSPLLRLAATGGIHGTVTFNGKDGVRTLAFERGTVTSVAGSVLTVRAADGTTWAWDIVGSTVIRESGHQVATGTLSDGDRVLVAGPVVSGTKDARIVRIRAGS
jgi:hypothetical protein